MPNRLLPIRTVLCLIGIVTLNGPVKAQPALPAFPSAREVKPEVRAHVNQTDSTYTYTYDVSNASGAQQSIDDFFVVIGDAPILGASQPRHWDCSHMTVKSVRTFDWGALVVSATISPGQNAKRFTLTSPTVPGIVIGHASGLIPPDTAADETEYDSTGRDELSNSVTFTTVGPKDPQAPFQPLLFLDTLSSYITRSRAYGWIADQRTADKYSEYFNSARSRLQSADVSAAVRGLQTVLTSVKADSVASLKGEAYALIRYDTEYLVSKIQEKN